MKQKLTVVQATLFVLTSIAFSGSAALAAHESHSFDDQMKPVLSGYIAVQEALSADSLTGVTDSAKRIAASAKTLDVSGISPEHAAHYSNLPEKIVSASRGLASAQTIEEAREAFKGLSRPMVMWATMSEPDDIDIVYCSMAKASWPQTVGNIRNPYCGSSMPACGDVMAGADKE